MSRGNRKGVTVVALIAVLFGILAAWAWSGNISANQREDRDDLELFLDASSAGWAEVTSQFFTVPEVAAQTIGALVGQMDGPEEQLALLAETIRRQPNLDAAYIGYPDGSFFFVARSDEFVPDGFRTRMISIDDDERSVELGWTDGNLKKIETKPDPLDVYDPRLRPWYEPLAQGEDRFWTPPYIFESSQQPGITHSTVVSGPDGELAAVVGIDMRLSAVNQFLEELSPGANGIALVVDGAGQIIAESSMDVGDVVVENSDGALALLESPELLGLVDQLDVADAGTALDRSSDGLRTTVVRRAGASEQWYVAVRALDEDFISEDTASDAFEVFAVAVTGAAAAAALGWGVLRYMGGLKSEAETDELTGIFNRRGVKRELQAMLHRSPESVHLAIIDLDDFKGVNDKHGHQVGDEVLTTIAARLEHFAALSGAAAGRLGGDEFVVVAEGAMPDWAWLNTRLAEPVVVGDRELAVTASIGVTQSTQGAADEIETLLGAADHGLFDAKRQGGDSFRAVPSGGTSGS